MELTPYIMFNGNCEEALNFYAKATGGSIENLMRFGDVPGGGGMPGANKDHVMHSHFKADGFMFMASDTGGPAPVGQGSGQVHLSINFENEAQQEKVFNALAEGGKVSMPLNDTFWGARFGMLTDKYGINWMFNCDKPKS
jgi:PhnB protein